MHHNTAQCQGLSELTRSKVEMRQTCAFSNKQPWEHRRGDYNSSKYIQSTKIVFVSQKSEKSSAIISKSKKERQSNNYMGSYKEKKP